MPLYSNQCGKRGSIIISSRGSLLPYASYAFIIVYFVSILCLILIATSRHTCTHTQRNTYAYVCVCSFIQLFCTLFSIWQHCLPAWLCRSRLVSCFCRFFCQVICSRSLVMCVILPPASLSLPSSFQSVVLLPFNSFSCCCCCFCCNWWCGSLIASARSSNICSTLFNYILLTHYAHQYTQKHTCCVRVNVPLYPFTRTQFRRKAMGERERAHSVTFCRLFSQMFSHASHSVIIPTCSRGREVK